MQQYGILLPRPDRLLLRVPVRSHPIEKAGADVLFAPGLPDLAAVRAIRTAVAKPVNSMVGIKGKSFSVSELAAAGIKRISLATVALSCGNDGFS